MSAPRSDESGDAIRCSCSMVAVNLHDRPELAIDPACPMHNPRPAVAAMTACKCGACPIDADYWAEAPTEAARQCAWGAEHGAWCCDCTDWTADDGVFAFQYLWGKEVKRRDILRAGLLHIAEHADLDHAERGIAEAERYAIVARDSVRKAGLYA